MKIKICLATLIGFFLLSLSLHAQGKLNVVATTEDLAAIAREVGGDHITVDSIAKGYQDPHFVEAKPSFILKLQRADILILVGRDLEIGWLPPLIQQSRNSKVQVGADGYLDASLQARILEIPQGQITRAEGDVHPLGNPHYWLDPENGKIIAREIFDKLVEDFPCDDFAIFRIEPVVRVTERVNISFRPCDLPLRDLKNSRLERRVQVSVRADLYFGITALLDQRRQPADLEIASYKDQYVGPLQLENEAGLRLDKVWILIALCDRIDRNVVTAHFSRDSGKILRRRNYIQFTLGM